MKQIVKPIDGVLHLIAYDQQGRELWSLQQSNQIVNGAYEIAAEALDCPLDNITVFGADTDSSPYDSGSYASSTTYVTGKAVEMLASGRSSSSRYRLTNSRSSSVGLRCSRLICPVMASCPAVTEATPLDT